MIERKITGVTLCLTVHHVEELDELSQLSFKANTDQATAFVSLHYVLGENNNSQCYESPDICPEFWLSIKLTLSVSHQLILCGRKCEVGGWPKHR